MAAPQLEWECSSRTVVPRQHADLFDVADLHHRGLGAFGTLKLGPGLKVAGFKGLAVSPRTAPDRWHLGCVVRPPCRLVGSRHRPLLFRSSQLIHRAGGVRDLSRRFPPYETRHWHFAASLGPGNVVVQCARLGQRNPHRSTPVQLGSHGRRVGARGSWEIEPPTPPRLHPLVLGAGQGLASALALVLFRREEEQ